MSTIDLAIQRVAGLDEQLASKLLTWLDSQEVTKTAAHQGRPLGARAMIGFALKDGRLPKTAADRMKEMRESDSE